MTRGVPVAVKDCSPSARLAYPLLNTEGALPQQSAQSLTGLSEDTVRHMLGELRDADAVLEHPDPTDRRRRYVLAEQLEIPTRRGAARRTSRCGGFGIRIPPGSRGPSETSTFLY